VLILGESGTGKELVARALHFNSRRQHAPFIPINCAALPENLLESELFGHRKGAFTGALQDKKGLFQEAEGGTIFLDEIGSMPAMLQSRLLRVLQDREVRRVGDNTPIYVNVRVLAATNEPLEKKMKDGHFREDLFYRLNVIPIPLPPLRERRDDVPLLVGHYLKRKVYARTGEPFQITRQAMAALCAHDWPGNVRELENAIERACALSDGSLIQLADLPSVVQRHAPQGETADGASASLPLGGGGRAEGATVFVLPKEEKPSKDGASLAPSANATSAPYKFEPLKEHLRAQEHGYLQRALAHVGGNKEKAAEMLGISLATLYRKLAGEDGG
jgi:DNA-binding NtrC family response regulator